jgi:hypothetical protein
MIAVSTMKDKIPKLCIVIVVWMSTLGVLFSLPRNVQSAIASSVMDEVPFSSLITQTAEHTK